MTLTSPKMRFIVQMSALALTALSGLLHLEAQVVMAALAGAATYTTVSKVGETVQHGKSIAAAAP